MARALRGTKTSPAGEHGIFTDALGQRIEVGATVLYAGYHSNRLRQATVTAFRERDGRPELLVKLHNDRGSVSTLHYPQRTFVLRASSTHQETT
jgi:hypothetical protein